MKLDKLSEEWTDYSRKGKKAFQQEQESIKQRHLRTDKLLYANSKWLIF